MGAGPKRPARPKGGEGQPQVADNTETGLAQLGARLTKARAKEAEILARLTQAVRAEHARGMSEYKLAEQAQVSRSTIRAWLGK